MLGELDIQVGHPVRSPTTEQVLQRALYLSLRVQSAGIDVDVTQLQRADPGNLRRADAPGD